MSSTSLGSCPDCGYVLYLTKAGILPRHLPDGRRNDGGVVPPQPRCEGSGKAPASVIR